MLEDGSHLIGGVRSRSGVEVRGDIGRGGGIALIKCGTVLKGVIALREGTVLRGCITLRGHIAEMRHYARGGSRPMAAS